MILRHIERRPLKSALSLLGIAMACGVMMVGGFQESAIDYMVDLQYGMSQREDMVATFTEPVAQHSLYSLRSLPGVQHVEGFRVVPAELRFGHRSYRTSVHGIEQQGSLLRLLDTENRVINIPDSGVILTDHLAGILGIEPGEMLEVEVLEGNRPNLEIPVAAVARQYLGVSAYMRREALNAALREGHALSGALLQVDSLALDEVHAVLRDMPRVAGVLEHRSSIRAFYETLAETVLFFTFITTLLGGSIAFGVVYNSVRIALSERSRELATLRVLGFQRSEVARILLGEMALLTLLAVPLGFVIGLGLCAFLVARFESDLYRIPLVLQRDVYAFAATVVLGSALVSALFIWRNLGQLDMVAVLKTKV